MTLRIAKAVRTCGGCPAQWDAWTDDGQYLYLRYRHGIGSVERQPSEDPDTWTDDLGVSLVTEWDDGTGNGFMSLTAFLAAAGLELAPGAVVVGEREV